MTGGWPGQSSVTMMAAGARLERFRGPATALGAGLLVPLAICRSLLKTL
jgi:hypothetical protein